MEPSTPIKTSVMIPQELIKRPNLPKYTPAGAVYLSKPCSFLWDTPRLTTSSSISFSGLLWSIDVSAYKKYPGAINLTGFFFFLEMYFEFREDPGWPLCTGLVGYFHCLGPMKINRVVSWHRFLLNSLRNLIQSDAFRSRCGLVWLLLLLNLGFVSQCILLSCLIVPFSLLGKQRFKTNASTPWGHHLTAPVREHQIYLFCFCLG